MYFINLKKGNKIYRLRTDLSSLHLVCVETQHWFLIFVLHFPMCSLFRREVCYTLFC